MIKIRIQIINPKTKIKEVCSKRFHLISHQIDKFIKMEKLLSLS